jgi:hypothetical protein
MLVMATGKGLPASLLNAAHSRFGGYIICVFIQHRIFARTLQFSRRSPENFQLE